VHRKINLTKRSFSNDFPNLVEVNFGIKDFQLDIRQYWVVYKLPRGKFSWFYIFYISIKIRTQSLLIFLQFKPRFIWVDRIITYDFHDRILGRISPFRTVGVLYKIRLHTLTIFNHHLLFNPLYILNLIELQFGAWWSGRRSFLLLCSLRDYHLLFLLQVFYVLFELLGSSDVDSIVNDIVWSHLDILILIIIWCLVLLSSKALWVVTYVNVSLRLGLRRSGGHRLIRILNLIHLLLVIWKSLCLRDWYQSINIWKCFLMSRSSQNCVLVNLLSDLLILLAEA